MFEVINFTEKINDMFRNSHYFEKKSRSIFGVKRFEYMNIILYIFGLVYWAMNVSDHAPQ